AEESLASQPTLSRFEQRSRRELLAMSEVLLDLWIERVVARSKKSHKKARLVLDLDSLTNGPQNRPRTLGARNALFFPRRERSGDCKAPLRVRPMLHNKRGRMPHSVRDRREVHPMAASSPADGKL